MTVNLHRPCRANQGYSLVELLLTTVLLLMFAGVAVFSFKTMSRGANLTEGALRFESVLRFVRAEAANSGRRVRVNFVPDTNALSLNATNTLNQIQLTWEPNPDTEPEQFTHFDGSPWGIDQVNETVGVESIRFPGDAPSEPEPVDESGGVDAEELTVMPEAAAETAPAYITFNPDGSSDSADITLTARHVEESRHVTMRVEGLTGAITRLEEPLTSEAENEAPADTPANGSEETR